MEKYSKFLTTIFVILIVLIIGLGAYIIYNFYDNYMADKSATELMIQFENDYEQENENNENNENNEADQPTEEHPNIEENNTQTNTNKTGTSTSYNIGTYYKEYKVIGIISIPKLNIQYPIFNVDNTATLRVGTAAIYPANVEAKLNTPGNAVIVGHHYRNSRMFSKIHTLQNGDSIYITNIWGEKLEYKVYNNYTANEYDFSYATRDVGDAIEISLSTCTNNASTRTIIWAKAEK